MSVITVSTKIDYVLKRSPRARYMRITIRRNGEVRVTAPYVTPAFHIEKFVSDKKEWIMKHVDHYLKHPVSEQSLLLSRKSIKDYRALKIKALELVTSRLEHFNLHYKQSYARITIRNQSSRWGSCSRKGNLSFNYKILYLDPKVQDYIVVHELCHLKEFNHSNKFWDLVCEMVPDWKECRKRLRGGSIG